MIADWIETTRQELLQLTDDLLKTKTELDSIPYFTRKKVRKYLDAHLNTDLDAVSALLLDVRPLLMDLEKQVREKRYGTLDGLLKTLKYGYLVRLHPLRRLESFYQEPCPPLLRYAEKKGTLPALKETYHERIQRIQQVDAHLQRIYNTLHVEEL